MARNAQAPQPAGKRTRILLVDDHPMVRERLAEIIQSEPDLVVCGEAEDRHEALDAIAATQPDLAIVDLSLKSSHGLELINDIHTRHPRLRMLVVSMHDESLHAERVLRAGAHGYITKQEATKKILLAIRRVLNGQLYVNEQIGARILAQRTGHQRDDRSLPTDKLSARELRVLELTGRGRNTREIADELHLSVKTVETYRARIKGKLQLQDAPDLLRFAIRWTQTG